MSAVMRGATLAQLAMAPVAPYISAAKIMVSRPISTLKWARWPAVRRRSSAALVMSPVESLTATMLLQSRARRATVCGAMVTLVLGLLLYRITGIAVLSAMVL